MFHKYLRVPNYNQFHFTDIHFRVTGYFETSAPKAPNNKMTLDEVKVTHYKVS